MKIGFDPDVAPLAGPAQPGRARDSASPATAAVPPATDRVELSPAVTRLAGIGGADEFDAAKVAAIRQAISNGNFRVDPGAIAGRLISQARALVGPSSSH